MILFFLMTISLFLNSCNCVEYGCKTCEGPIPDSDFRDWKYTRYSQCEGQFIKKLYRFSAGYFDVFDECEKHRRCGCIDTCNGLAWRLYEGTNTSARHPPWWSKLCTTKPMPMCHWLTCHTWTYKKFEKEKNCGRRNCP